MILINPVYSYVLLHFVAIGLANIIKHPRSVIEFENTTATLSCEATASGPITYQWRRVNGEISRDRAKGINRRKLAISPVQQEDEDEYYCVASYGVVNGINHNDTSHRANVTIYGKELKSLAIYNHNIDRSPNTTIS